MVEIRRNDSGIRGIIYEMTQTIRIDYSYNIKCLICFIGRGRNMGAEESRGGNSGLFTSTGTILVLFILLVIVSRVFV